MIRSNNHTGPLIRTTVSCKLPTHNIRWLNSVKKSRFLSRSFAFELGNKLVTDVRDVQANPYWKIDDLYIDFSFEHKHHIEPGHAQRMLDWLVHRECCESPQADISPDYIRNLEVQIAKKNSRVVTIIASNNSHPLRIKFGWDWSKLRPAFSVLRGSMSTRAQRIMRLERSGWSIPNDEFVRYIESATDPQVRLSAMLAFEHKFPPDYQVHDFGILEYVFNMKNRVKRINICDFST